MCKLLQNNLEDLYSLLCFLHVEPWCNWAWWNKLIQRPYENGDPRGLRLIKAILRPLMLRRTKESKDKEGRPILVLPPTDIQIIECAQSEAERDFYDALFKRSKVNATTISDVCFLHVPFHVLVSDTCGYKTCSRGDSQKFADLNKLAKRFLESNSDSVSSAPMAPTKAYVEEVVDGIRRGENSECPICMEFADDPVLTPCAHRMCRECLLSSWRAPTAGSKSILRRTGRNHQKSQVSCIAWNEFVLPVPRRRIGYLRYDGGLSQKQRERVLNEFNETEEKMVLLMSLRAGGVGLNLTAASNVFLMDPWWNPAVEEQAIMRIHRIGQKRTVSVRTV
ncbi:TNF receptor-associated factor [Trema orientale]|uniref:TNF receptor-associated factor n=1 Tax=Trema orientale TaxID=63057 RepID=A0A2P5FLN9_TREOI|nr:TNF receptor-associated factor [Trema orientale]